MRITEQESRSAVLSISSKIYNDEIPVTIHKDIDILVHAANKQIGRKVVVSETYGSYRCPQCNHVINFSQH